MGVDATWAARARCSGADSMAGRVVTFPGLRMGRGGPDLLVPGPLSAKGTDFVSGDFDLGTWSFT
eukprot:2946034-Pyramimonas_sp.AAC.1